MVTKNLPSRTLSRQIILSSGTPGVRYSLNSRRIFSLYVSLKCVTLSKVFKYALSQSEALANEESGWIYRFENPP